MCWFRRYFCSAGDLQLLARAASARPFPFAGADILEMKINIAIVRGRRPKGNLEVPNIGRGRTVIVLSFGFFAALRSAFPFRALPMVIGTGFCILTIFDSRINEIVSF